MIIDDNHYDVIVIGSGAGGGTLAGQLARSGKSVLLLERGSAMPLSDQNVADVDLFRKDRYHPGEPQSSRTGTCSWASSCGASQSLNRFTKPQGCLNAGHGQRIKVMRVQLIACRGDHLSLG